MKISYSKIENKIENIDDRKLQLFLSHHLEGEYDRCLNLPFGNKHWRICTRCTGVYIGILTGILSNLLVSINPSTLAIIMFFFPLPAFIDFYLNQANIYNGTNATRLITGVLLGFMYPNFVFGVLSRPLVLYPYMAIMLYGILALLLINKNKQA